MGAIGNRAGGRDADDLLHEALVATLQGRRTWPDTVPLQAHLIASMRSISNAWIQKTTFELRKTVSDRHEPATANSPESISAINFDSFPARDPNPETLARARQQIESLTEALGRDLGARRVLVKMMDGWQDKDIPAELGMPRKVYEAAKKRIQRRFQKIAGMGNGQQKRTANEVP